MDEWRAMMGLAVAVCVLAFISLVETALVSVSHARVRQLVDSGHPTAPLLDALIARPRELLGAVVVVVTGCVLLAATLTTTLAVRLWGDGMMTWATLLLLLVVLIAARVVPKTVGVAFAEPIALHTARLADLLVRILTPFVTLVRAISTGVLQLLIAVRVLAGHVRAVPTALRDDGIKQLISAGELSGEVAAAEREMIHGVIEFSETTAGEIMVPRTDLIALPIDVSLAQAIDVFTASGHSRIPVYQDDVDHIVGLLYIKDILIRLKAAEHTDATPAVPDLLRPAYFVPETKKSDELLREMQRRQLHFAIVVDEYGGTAGLVTIEDLLEEIVGEIIDEYDQERFDIITQPDGSLRISGRASLEMLQDALNISLPEETDAETISGLITEIIGRIPLPGDRLTISGVEFTVQEVAHHRIESLTAHPATE